MKEIQKSAKTVEKAIEEALAELKAAREEVEIEILDEGSKGFLGFGSRDAVVKVSRKFNPEKVAKDFLREVFEAMNLVVVIDVKYDEENRNMDIELSGEEMGVLIGKRGQTLDSLQYLISLVVNKESDSYIKVKVDTEDYRERRKATLENLAKNLSYKVKRTRRPVTLEPMNPYERRIIHSALQNDRYVETHSEGDEPYRKVVITLKRREREYRKDYKNYKEKNA